MAQPTASDVHVDQILTNISVAYMNEPNSFVASKVFPQVPVQKQSNKYYTYTKADWFRDEARLRADATESAGSGYGLSTSTYSCDVYAMHKDIGDQVRANTDSPLDPDRDATQFITQRLLLRQEIQWVTDYFTTSVWGTDSTPASLWSDYTSSDPISDIETGKRTILVNTGYVPNTLVCSYDVWIKLKNHPDMIDRIKYSASAANPAVSSESAVAQVLGVERLLVASAIKNSAVESETASYGFTHGKSALLCYVSPSPGILSPSAGYQFVWQGVSGGLGQNIGISRMRLEHLKADRIEGQTAWDNKVVGSDLGYFFNGAVA